MDRIICYYEKRCRSFGNKKCKNCINNTWNDAQDFFEPKPKKWEKEF